jgi:hypothetical protein
MVCNASLTRKSILQLSNIPKIEFTINNFSLKTIEDLRQNGTKILLLGRFSKICIIPKRLVFSQTGYIVKN